MREVSLQNISIGFSVRKIGENGTIYVSLFDAIAAEEQNPLWMDYIGAVVGEDMIPAMAAAFQGSVTAELHGKDAIFAFKDGG